MNYDSHKFDPAQKLLDYLNISSLSRKSCNDCDDIYDAGRQRFDEIIKSSNIVFLYKDQHDRYDGYELDEKIEKLRFAFGIKDKETTKFYVKFNRCWLIRSFLKAKQSVSDAIPNIPKGVGVAAAASLLFFAYVPWAGEVTGLREPTADYVQDSGRMRAALLSHDIQPEIKKIEEAINEILSLKERVLQLEIGKIGKYTDEKADDKDIVKSLPDAKNKPMALLQAVEINKFMSEAISIPKSKDNFAAYYVRFSNNDAGPTSILCAPEDKKGVQMNLRSASHYLEFNCKDLYGDTRIPTLISENK